jgi:NAD(P)-dependent dehydrogenase (short-subunit alcohol dehydrogenase family)
VTEASFKKEKIKKTGAAYPIKRPAQPVELAPSYVFLASSDSQYINGEVLGVTGGKPL